MTNEDSEETREVIRAAKAEFEAKRRRHKKNSVLSVVSNFMLALAIASVGSGIAQTLLALKKDSAPIDSITREIFTILVGLLFFTISAMTAYAKEPEK